MIEENEGEREAAASGTRKGKEDRVGAGAFEDGILLAVGGSGADSWGASEIERRGAARRGNAGAAGTGSNRSGWAGSEGGAKSVLDAEQAERNCDDGGG